MDDLDESKYNKIDISGFKPIVKNTYTGKVDNNYLIRDLDSFENFKKDEKIEKDRYFKLELTKAPEPTDIIWENLFMEEDQINTRMW